MRRLMGTPKLVLSIGHYNIRSAMKREGECVSQSSVWYPQWRIGFTMIEMILVIVVIGIIAKLGVEAIRPNYLLNDSHFVLMKIKEAQYAGIGYDHRSFGGGEINDTQAIGCLVLDRDHLNETMREGKVHYTLHTTLSGGLAGEKLCFDHLGAPHLGDHQSAYTQAKYLTLRYGSQEVNLTVVPKSGYAILIN